MRIIKLKEANEFKKDLDRFQMLFLFNEAILLEDFYYYKFKDLEIFPIDPPEYYNN